MAIPFLIWLPTWLRKRIYLSDLFVLDDGSLTDLSVGFPALDFCVFGSRQ